MLVLFVLGIPDTVDTVDEATWSGPLAGNAPLGEAVRPALERRGWQVAALRLGKTKPRRLKKPDVIVNCICDPDIQSRSLGQLAEIVEQSGVPVLNAPSAVGRTGRVGAWEALGGQADVCFPLTSRYAADRGPFADHLAAAGHAAPLIVRPPGSHGGVGLCRVETAADLPADLAALPNLIVADFADYASPDGLYRKYRVIFAGGHLFRRHLIIADDWNIGGMSRTFMVGKAALIAEEMAFLRRFDDTVEKCLADQFHTLGLDFGVADFAVDAAGRITLFEINPCFQITGSIPADKMERWGYLEDTNELIIEALADAVVARAGDVRQT
jgi:hypothetical protein